MDATRVADLLEEIADLLELQDENPFKTRAYVNAARTLRAHQDRDLAELVESGDLARLPGFGKAITEKVTTLVTTGRLPYIEELRASMPAGLLELVKIPGLGPKKARLLVEHLHVSTVGELEYACNENRLLHLGGFGAKSQEKILDAIRKMRQLERPVGVGGRPEDGQDSRDQEEALDRGDRRDEQVEVALRRLDLDLGVVVPVVLDHELKERDGEQ